MISPIFLFINSCSINIEIKFLLFQFKLRTVIRFTMRRSRTRRITLYIRIEQIDRLVAEFAVTGAFKLGSHSVCIKI